MSQGNAARKLDTATVVGVVGDVRFATIDSLPAADTYIPYYQSPRSGAMVYLKTTGDPGAFAAAARRAIYEVGSDLPVYDVRTLASRVQDATAQARFSALLLAVFAGAALVLATLGIYGVIAFAVAQRTREIGIRIALGADRPAVLRLVVGQGAVLTAAGLGCLIFGLDRVVRRDRTALDKRLRRYGGRAHQLSDEEQKQAASQQVTQSPSQTAR